MRIPVQATSIEALLYSEGNTVTPDGGCPVAELKANFEAIAVALSK